MEKILLAVDAGSLNMNAIDFACYITKLNHSRLTGLFLEGLLPAERIYASESAHPGPDGVVGKKAIEEEGAADAEYRADDPEENIRKFREACVCRETLSAVHRDRGVGLSEVIEESRFADLLIIDPETFLSRRDRSAPGRFVKDVLIESECPVLIAPYRYEPVEEIYFAYQDSSSSLFAIKQFTYLFPGLANKKCVLINVRPDGGDVIEEQYKMKEWLKNHYENVEFVILKGEASDELFAHLMGRKNGLVVMGSYGRSIFSRFFRPSHSRLVIKTLNLPVFIAHR
jgi:nucleotide-binding universal stress UspA family protein